MKNWTTATDEELRVRVAELCGWCDIEKAVFYEGEIVGRYPKDASRRRIPNYPADLNAMADAEKTMITQTGEPPVCLECFKYRDLLQKMVNPNQQYVTHSGMCVFGATARQRAIAFCMVMEGK